MPQPRRRPAVSAPAIPIVLRTYGELETFVRAFADGHINLLIIVGEPGLSKGTTVRNTLGDDACWIEGNATAFGIYLKLYAHRDVPVVLDDLDDLHASKNAIRLLKCLCQTEPEKRVAWPTAARELKQEGVPREFTTRSRVVIISNEWHTRNRNVAAVEDRGHFVHFRPTALEVHRKTMEWFRDEEILLYFEERLDQIACPSMRHYYRARELKQAGLDWKDLLPLGEPNSRRRLVRELLRDSTFRTQESRARAFTERGGGCRATYFNYVQRLR